MSATDLVRLAVDAATGAGATSSDAVVIENDGVTVLVRDGHTERVGSLAWNRHILSSGGRDSIVVNHDVRIARHNVATLSGHSQEVCGLTWSPDGLTLASGGNDNTLRVRDVAQGRALKTLRGHAGQISDCRFTPQGDGVLSASHDHTARLWSLAGYEEARVFRGRVLRGHRDAILGAASLGDIGSHFPYVSTVS